MDVGLPFTLHACINGAAAIWLNYKSMLKIGILACNTTKEVNLNITEEQLQCRVSYDFSLPLYGLASPLAILILKFEIEKKKKKYIYIYIYFYIIYSITIKIIIMIGLGERVFQPRNIPRKINHAIAFS